MHRNHKIHGFTLIEVLVALTILAIASIAVMHSIHATVRDTGHVQDKWMAHFVALNVLSAMQTGRQAIPGQGDELEGRMVWGGRPWSWQVAVLPESVDQGAAYYERLSIDVTRQDGQQYAHMEGFVVTPTR